MPLDPEIQSFYRSCGAVTDPGRYRGFLDRLPRGIEELCNVVQGLVLHLHWARSYGVVSPERRQSDAQLRTLASMLERVMELDGRPLGEARPPELRLVGVCRHFALLLCAILRHQGVPARARCGFAAYFSPGEFVDHWVCEHWDAGRGVWVRTDAQLDALQRASLEPPFDPLDVPSDQFLVAGRAWQLCQSGDADPAKFGIFDMQGLWFIRGNLLRDLAALNRVELLPWDCWGLMLQLGEKDESTVEVLELLDRVAALTQKSDEAFDELRDVYSSEPTLAVPASVTNYQTGAQEQVGV